MPVSLCDDRHAKGASWQLGGTSSSFVCQCGGRQSRLVLLEPPVQDVL